MEINDPRLEAYFNYELSAEEASAFLEEAKLHPEIWQEIQFKQWMIDGIQDEGRIELKEFIGNRLAEEREESTGKFWYAAAAIAITLVVGFGIAWPYLNQTNKNSESKYAADSTFHENNEKSMGSLADSKNEPRELSTPGDTINSGIAMNYSYDETLGPNELESDREEYSDKDGSAELSAAPDAVVETRTYKWEDIAAEKKQSAPLENNSMSINRSRNGYLGADIPSAAATMDKSIVQIASFQVVPIDPLRLKLNQNENDDRLAGAIAPITMAKSKSKTPSALSNQQAANNGKLLAPSSAADTLRENTISDKSRNSNFVKEDFSIVLTRSDNGKPSGITQKVVTPQGNQYSIILNNFGDANAVLYRLNTTYYLGIDTHYYQIDLTPGKVWTPQKVTNKAILEQLNP